MALAYRTDVPASRLRSPSRRKVTFTLDEQTLRLGRACAQHRCMPFSAWLAKATVHHVEFAEGLRIIGEVLTELGIAPDEEKDRQIRAKLGRIPLIPYAPSGPRQRVWTTLDQETLDRVRGVAEHADMSVSAWLAQAAWKHVQVDPRLLAAELEAVERELDLSEETRPNPATAGDIG